MHTNKLSRAAVNWTALRPHAISIHSTPLKQRGVHTRVTIDQLDHGPREIMNRRGPGRRIVCTHCHTA